MALRPMQRPVLIMYTEVATFFIHITFAMTINMRNNVPNTMFSYFNLHSTAHEASQIYF